MPYRGVDRGLASRLSIGAVALAGASAANKLGMLALNARMGHLGGAEALGAATSVLAGAGVLTAFSHVGLPDRALYRAAKSPDAPLGGAHALFLVTAALAALGSVGLAVAAAEDRLVGVLLALGATGQHTAAFALAALRGASRPALEALVVTLGAAVVIACSFGPTMTWAAGGYAAQGVVFGLAALLYSFRLLPTLQPEMPQIRAILPELKVSMSYFIIGVGAMIIGSSDILLARWVLTNEAVGALTCATVVLRTGLMLPWIVSTLWLRSLHRRSSKPQLPVVLSIGAGIWSVTALLAWVSPTVVGHVMGVPTESFLSAAHYAVFLSFPYYVSIALLPLTTSFRRQRVVTVVPLALFVGVGAMVVLAGQRGLSGIQEGHALGYALLAIALGWALKRRAPEDVNAS